MDPISTHTAFVTTSALEPGERVKTTFRADKGTYWRENAWLAAFAMAGGMGVLWVLGNEHIWTGAVGGLFAIAVRAFYLASDEVRMEWQLTDRRLLGPGTRAIPLSQIAKVATLFSAVQIVTETGDKHLMKYQGNTGAVKAEIEAALRGAAE